MSKPLLRDSLLRAIAWKCGAWEKESGRKDRFFSGRKSDDAFQIGDEKVRLFDPNLNAVLYRNGYEGYWVKKVFMNPFERNVDTVRLVFGRIGRTHQIGETYICEMEFIVKPRELKAYHYFSADSVMYVDIEAANLERDYALLAGIVEWRAKLLCAAGPLAWLRLAESLADDQHATLCCHYSAALMRHIQVFEDRKVRRVLYDRLQALNPTARCEQLAFSRLIPSSFGSRHVGGRIPLVALRDVQQRLMAPLAALKAALPVTGTESVPGYYISHLKECVADGQREYGDSRFASPDFTRILRAENPDICERVKTIIRRFPPIARQTGEEVRDVME
jgi:hypothetical protein